MLQRLSKNERFTLMATLALVAAVLVAAVAAYLAIFRGMIRQDADFFLDEISTQSSLLANQGLQDDYQHLEHMATAIAELQTDLLSPAAADYLRQAASTSESVQCYLLMDRAGALLRSHDRMELSPDRAGHLAALAGESYLSDPVLLPGTDGETVLYLTVPVLRGGVPVASLTSVCTASNYPPLHPAATFDGLGYSCVIRANGTAVAMPQAHMDQFPPFSFRASFEDGDVLADYPQLRHLPQEMAAGETGTVRYEMPSGAEYYLSYAPMGLKDWYLVSTVPADAIFAKLGIVSIMTVSVFLLALLLYTLVVVILSRAGRRRRAEAQRAACHDALTGLPGPKLVAHAFDHLDMPGRSYACILVDISRRLLLRHTFSQSAADDLIRKISARLRSFAGSDGQAFALGEERFFLVVPVPQSTTFLSELRILADQLEMLNVVEAGVDYEFHCTFVCEAYLLTAEDTSPHTVLQMMLLGAPSRDTSLEHSHCSLITQEVKERLLLRVFLSDQVVPALDQGQLLPYFQPQYDLNTGRIVGAEVLARWQHPVCGLLRPGDFMPVLERTGHILDLDLYMLESACMEIRRWTQAELLPVPVTVNISPLNCYKPDFVEKVAAVIDCYQVPPVLIVLEMSEAAAMENNGVQLRAVTEQLHALGVLLCLDDFGSGASSLTLLPALPIDILKLGRSFYQEGELTPREQCILGGVMDMSRQLNMQVVAQNVERPAQAELLRAAGCHAAQGYLYSKPLSSDQFEQLIF